MFRNKVTCLAYAAVGQQLFSGGEDSQIVCWDMTVKRKEVSSDLFSWSLIKQKSHLDSWLVWVGHVPAVWQALFLECPSHDGPKAARIETTPLPTVRKGCVRQVLQPSHYPPRFGARIPCQGLWALLHHCQRCSVSAMQFFSCKNQKSWVYFVYFMANWLKLNIF